MRKIYDIISITVLALVFAMFFNNNIANAKTVAKDEINGYKIAVEQDHSGTKVHWNGKVYNWFDFNCKVRIISEKKLTAKMLRSRKNKVLYIEKVVGRVINKTLDGRTTNGKPISYRSLGRKVRIGDKVVTYFVYSPYTHWIDDYQSRFDVPLKYHR